MVKKTSNTEKPRPKRLRGEFYQTSKEQITPILHNHFQKNRIYFPTHEVSITLTPNTQRRQQKRKPQTNVISFMNTGAKVLNKNYQTKGSKT